MTKKRKNNAHTNKMQTTRPTTRANQEIEGEGHLVVETPIRKAAPLFVKTIQNKRKYAVKMKMDQMIKGESVDNNESKSLAPPIIIHSLNDEADEKDKMLAPDVTTESHNTATTTNTTINDDSNEDDEGDDEEDETTQQNLCVLKTLLQTARCTNAGIDDDGKLGFGGGLGLISSPSNSMEPLLNLFNSHGTTKTESKQHRELLLGIIGNKEKQAQNQKQQGQKRKSKKVKDNDDENTSLDRPSIISPTETPENAVTMKRKQRKRKQKTLFQKRHARQLFTTIAKTLETIVQGQLFLPPEDDDDEEEDAEETIEDIEDDVTTSSAMTTKTPLKSKTLRWKEQQWKKEQQQEKKKEQEKKKKNQAEEKEEDPLILKSMQYMQICVALVDAYLDNLLSLRSTTTTASRISITGTIIRTPSRRRRRPAMTNREMSPSPEKSNSTVEFPILDPVIDVALLLHDSLFDLQTILPSSTSSSNNNSALITEGQKLQNLISCMCEKWWFAQFKARDELITQLLPHLLHQSLECETTGMLIMQQQHVNDDTDTSTTILLKQHATALIHKPLYYIKRLYKLRYAFQLFDFRDLESISHLKSLILQTIHNPHYLKNLDGRRFIVHSFVLLDEDLMMECHAVIKGQMIVGVNGSGRNKNVLDLYGDVYLRGWKEAYNAVETSRKMLSRDDEHDDYDLSDDEENPHSIAQSILQTFEQSILQELMHASIHAVNTTLTSNLRNHVLKPLHAAKKIPTIDSLLHRMYSPILWRALKSNNSQIRIQSAHCLAQTFPLHDAAAATGDTLSAAKSRASLCASSSSGRKVSVSNRQNANALLEDGVAMGTHALEELLQDDVPAVRSVGCESSVEIMAGFWDGLCHDTIRMLLTHIITKHANDTSSAQVRSTAINSITTLLVTCPQSHAVLRNLLPSLGNLIHDTTERVRFSVVKMLLTIKTLRGVRYYHVVPLDHLLARLAYDGLKHKHATSLSSTSSHPNQNNNSKVVLGLIELLFNSYFPQKKGGPNNSTGIGDRKSSITTKASDQIQRTLLLLSDNPNAARVFYGSLYHFVSVPQIAKLCVLLLKCLSSSVEVEIQEEESKATEDRRRRKSRISERIRSTAIVRSSSKKRARKRSSNLKNKNDNDEISITATQSLSGAEQQHEPNTIRTATKTSLIASNTSLMASISETINLLWESVDDQISESSNKPSNDFLQQAFSGKVLTNIHSHFDTKATALLETPPFKSSATSTCDNAKSDNSNNNGNDVDEDRKIKQIINKRINDCHRTCAALLRCAGRIPYSNAVTGLSTLMVQKLDQMASATLASGNTNISNAVGNNAVAISTPTVMRHEDSPLSSSATITNDILSHKKQPQRLLLPTTIMDDHYHNKSPYVLMSLFCLWGHVEQVAISLASSISMAFHDDHYHASCSLENTNDLNKRSSSRGKDSSTCGKRRSMRVLFAEQQNKPSNNGLGRTNRRKIQKDQIISNNDNNAATKTPILPRLPPSMALQVLNCILSGGGETGDAGSLAAREALFSSSSACNVLESALGLYTFAAERLLHTPAEMGVCLLSELDVVLILTACECLGRMSLHKEAHLQFSRGRNFPKDEEHDTTVQKQQQTNNKTSKELGKEDPDQEQQLKPLLQLDATTNKLLNWISNQVIPYLEHNIEFLSKSQYDSVQQHQRNSKSPSAGMAAMLMMTDLNNLDISRISSVADTSTIFPNFSPSLLDGSGRSSSASKKQPPLPTPRRSPRNSVGRNSSASKKQPSLPTPRRRSPRNILSNNGTNNNDTPTKTDLIGIVNGCKNSNSSKDNKEGRPNSLGVTGSSSSSSSSRNHINNNHKLSANLINVVTATTDNRFSLLSNTTNTNGKPISFNISSRLAQHSSVSLLKSAAILLSEWLAVGGGGSKSSSTNKNSSGSNDEACSNTSIDDAISVCTLNWCRVLSYPSHYQNRITSINKGEMNSYIGRELLPAFARLSVQFIQSRYDFRLLKELLRVRCQAASFAPKGDALTWKKGKRDGSVKCRKNYIDDRDETRHDGEDESVGSTSSSLHREDKQQQKQQQQQDAEFQTIHKFLQTVISVLKSPYAQPTSFDDFVCVLIDVVRQSILGENEKDDEEPTAKTTIDASAAPFTVVDSKAETVMNTASKSTAANPPLDIDLEESCLSISGKIDRNPLVRLILDTILNNGYCGVAFAKLLSRRTTSDSKDKEKKKDGYRSRIRALNPSFDCHCLDLLKKQTFKKSFQTNITAIVNTILLPTPPTATTTTTIATKLVAVPTPTKAAIEDKNAILSIQNDVINQNNVTHDDIVSTNAPQEISVEGRAME